MIEAGALEDPGPDLILGMHLWNEQPVGWLGISPGPVMAASETFKIEVIGKGGHGGIPHKAHDPVVASAAIINSLQSLISRETAPLDSAVITVATIHGGETHNVIPESVEMEGTIRTFRPETREQVLIRFKEIVEGTAAVHRCQARIEIVDISPAVVNDPQAAEVMRGIANELFPDFEVDANYQTTASEDMAYLMQDFPACYSFVGSANPELGLTAKHHQPDFSFDESALKTGTALMLGAVLKYLD
jgi:amidohydrolase